MELRKQLSECCGAIIEENWAGLKIEACMKCGMPVDNIKTQGDSRCATCNCHGETGLEFSKNRVCPHCQPPESPKPSQPEYAKKKNEELEEIKKNVMPDFICEKCFARIQYPYPEIHTICNQCSGASQLTEEDRELERENFHYEVELDEVLGNFHDLVSQSYALHNFLRKTLAQKDRKAEERVRNLEEKLSVKSFKAAVKKRVREAVEDERKRCAKVVHDELSGQATPSYEFIGVIMQEIEEQILNPEPPKD